MKFFNLLELHRIIYRKGWKKAGGFINIECERLNVQKLASYNEII